MGLNFGKTIGFSPSSADSGLKSMLLKRIGVSPFFSPVSVDLGPKFSAVESRDRASLKLIFFSG